MWPLFWDGLAWGVGFAVGVWLACLALDAVERRRWQKRNAEWLRLVSRLRGEPLRLGEVLKARGEG